MIKGLIVQMTSDALLAHLYAREDHHRDRAGFYAAKGDELEAGGDQPQNITNDPVKAMRDRAAHHLEKADGFHVLATYLIPGEMYQLDSNDLRRVELASL